MRCARTRPPRPTTGRLRPWVASVRTACASLAHTGPCCPTTWQGEFVNNQYSGHGTYTFPDGSTYEGAFKEGQMHGAGCFTDKQARATPPWTHPPTPRAWAARSLARALRIQLPTLRHRRSCRAAQGVSWKGKFYNGMGPGLPTDATFLAA